MRILCLFISFVIGSWSQNNNVYGIHITTLDDEDKLMDQFNGKKIVLVVLPLIQTSDDSTFIRRLNKLNSSYQNKVSVIAVPSIEDGYTRDKLSALRFYYRSLFDSSITITAAMYTRKTSGGNQHQLFHWLTFASENDHYDDDVSGAKEMFFLNERGELFGVASPDAVTSKKVMDRLINN